jgi:LPS-assembly protein
MTSGRGVTTDLMFRVSSILVIIVAVEWLGVPAPVRAQSSLAGCTAYKQQNMTGGRIQGDHFVFDGTPDAPVQIDCDNMRLSADHLEYFQKEGRVIARGSVVYISAGNRIIAERMEFNTKTRTGTFYVASGTATLREKASPGIAGAQEPDLMFRGDEIHKIGPKKYRIVGGNFTTCVQPTPRWEMHSRSITLNLDDYALLKNAVLRVKNVPLMYLPIFYYPIQEDDRATGFVMPIYGSTTARGQSLSNAFFWAISRNQDATLMHDWFSKAGQQVGGEYRYILSPGSEGSSTVSFLNEQIAQTDGTKGPATRSYTVVGGVVQRLPLNLRLRANANYYSSIVTQQRYQQDIYRATNSNRRMNTNLSGNWNEYSLSVTADRNDYFGDATSFSTTGSLPRVSLSRSERPIAGSPLYFGVSSEVVTLQRSTTTDNVKTSDNGLSRFDVNPTLRIPFTRWPFLTVNSTVSWRGTYWTESCAAREAGTGDTRCPQGGDRVQLPDAIGRQFFDFHARITGPVFNRIWNTEGNGYAEKFKHVIEPTLSIQRTTSIDNFDRIVQLEGNDYIVGETTRYTYGVTNRLYAKKGTSREILGATVSQSYNTNALASQYDAQNLAAFGQTAPTHFNPVVLSVRASPTDHLQGVFRTDWDPTKHTLRTIQANGSFSSGAWLHTSAGWSQVRYIPGLRGFDNPAFATNYINASTDVGRAGGRRGASYSFNYDLRRDTFLQQRYTAYYNAQCCGIAVEYQSFNLSGSFAGLGITEDHRFNLSFTLAGVGTFSNLFGAFGGQQGR